MLADTTDFIKCIAYNAKFADVLTEGRSLVLRNYVFRDNIVRLELCVPRQHRPSNKPDENSQVYMTFSSHLPLLLCTPTDSAIPCTFVLSLIYIYMFALSPPVTSAVL